MRGFYQSPSEKMISDIMRHAYESALYTGIDEFSESVKEAMIKVPREDFLPEDMKRYAYEDRAMSIGCGQTISQPFIVALMVEVLHLNSESTVLEIGSGCGYHAAVLSRLAKKVYTIEIVPELAILAQGNLKNYKNVEVSQRNGQYGWPEKAPFDAITVAAASEDIPPALIRQLKPGGRMIIPIGEAGQAQSLDLVIKSPEGEITARPVLPVVFVPFVKN